MATTEQHRAISDQFLEQAEQEFARGDLLQASEKAWGAFSHAVNAHARQRGWPIGSHRNLIENAHRLIDRQPREATYRRRLVRALEALHANFYQAFLDEASVRDGINDARELIGALDELAAQS